LNDQLRFALLLQGPDYRNELPAQGMVRSDDANTLEVTGT